jgi:hypothetical protein
MRKLMKLTVLIAAAAAPALAQPLYTVTDLPDYT